MAFPTPTGEAIDGRLHREPQICLGAAYAGATYQFFDTGTNTAANVYEDGALTTPFPITGYVQADNYGRFPPIYLDPSVEYKVQLYDSQNNLVWTVDPYIAPLATTGTSSKSAYGVQIAATGEVTLPAPNSGGTGVTLTLNAGAMGSAPLQISAAVAGNSALIINNSATTGAQTATFTATNKPGTATSSPAGWLPITCDGVQYYTPIWHGNNFTPYTPSPSAVGEVITGQSVVFGGNGVTTVTGGTATPGNWFVPSSANIGSGYYIKITKTGGLSGLAFSAAQGAWTNIGAGGLTISSNAAAQITGSYQLSSSGTGSPVLASGTITLSGNNGVQSPTYNGQPSLVLGGDGTATVNGASASNWYAPTTANVGSGYWINITRTGGSTGVNFTAAQGAWTNITNGGLTISIGGSGGQYATGTYQIASDSLGANVLGSGSITLQNANVQSPNWSGSPALVVGGDGTATVNGTAQGSWYLPTTAGIGAGFYFTITRTGGTTGVNFSNAQGSWVNIGSGGLSINITGYTGDVGTATASGTWQISNSPSGSPVLGSGSVSLSVTGLTVIHVYTSGSGTEIIPIGTTNVYAEAFGGGGGAGNGGNVSNPGYGGAGGSGARCYSAVLASSLGGPGKSFNYSVGAAVAHSTNGNASTITAGTVTGWTNISAGGGIAGTAFSGGGAGGAGGTATGGATSNTNGNNGASNSSSSTPGLGGLISGDGAPYGAAGGSVQIGNGNGGAPGAVIFYYT